MRKIYLSRQQSRMAALDMPVGDPTGGAAYGEFNDPVTAIVGGGAMIGSALLGSEASSDASDAQLQGVRESNQTNKEIFDQTRADQAPWRAAGENALAKLLAGIGQNGQFMHRFGMSDFQQDPGYQFRLAEGQKAINRSAAAQGNLLSGATMKALAKYGQGVASEEYGNAYNRYNNDITNQFNRLSGIAGTGQQANNTVASAGQSYANNVGQNQLAAGNARASGYMGSANALSNGITQGIGMYQNNQLLNKLAGGSTGAMGGRMANNAGVMGSTGLSATELMGAF